MASKKDAQALAGADNASSQKSSKSESKRSKSASKKNRQKQQQQQQQQQQQLEKVINAPVESAAATQDTAATGTNGKKAAKKRSGYATRAPALDPLLLARGMSSRYISSKISHQLTPLPKDAIEKDLRHMDAYRNACNGYNHLNIARNLPATEKFELQEAEMLNGRVAMLALAFFAAWEVTTGTPVISAF